MISSRTHVAIFFVFLVPFFVIIYFSITPKPFSYPFRCYSFNEYNFDNLSIKFDLSQDVRFFDNGSGFVRFSGIATNHAEKTQFNRKISLVKNKVIDNDMLEFIISDVEKANNDNTPEAVSNVLLGEFGLQNKELYLDIYKLKEGIWLIGTSSSYLTTCLLY